MTSVDKELGDLEAPEVKDEHRENFALVRTIGQLPAEQWPDERILAIRQMFGVEAKSMGQLATFLSISHSVGLNPALGEIWLIYTTKGPKCYSGRDGFLRSADRQLGRMYGGIESGIVYAEDTFEVEYRIDPETGKQGIFITHIWSPLTRTSKYPHGAYAIVYDAHQRPTFIYRTWAKCAQMKSFYWKDHGDDAIHNRAIAAGLRRVVPLGGLLIEGETLVGDPAMAEQFVERSTTAKLKDLSAKLSGANAEEEVEETEFVVLENDGHPPIEDLRKTLEELCSKYRVTGPALQAWAADSAGFPDEPGGWGKDNIIVVCQEIEASEGLEVMQNLARRMAENIDDDEERIAVLNQVLNSDREKLDKLLERLSEVSP